MDLCQIFFILILSYSSYQCLRTKFENSLKFILVNHGHTLLVVKQSCFNIVRQNNETFSFLFTVVVLFESLEHKVSKVQSNPFALGGLSSNRMLLLDREKTLHTRNMTFCKKNNTARNIIWLFTRESIEPRCVEKKCDVSLSFKLTLLEVFFASPRTSLFWSNPTNFVFGRDLYVMLWALFSPYCAIFFVLYRLFVMW